MARRVNKKFLVIITIVLCCLLMAAVALKRIHFHGSAYYAALGEKQEAAGNLEEAGQDYGRAFQYGHPQNPDYLMKLGDVYLKETATDPRQLGAAVSTWRKALEIDPNYVPALKRLVKIFSQEMQFGIRPETLSALTDFAKRLHTADPTDANAAAWVKIAPVEAYVGGVATDPVKLEGELADLQKVYLADPSNVQAMMVAAQAHLHLSEAAGRNDNPDEADRQRQLACSTFDNALKKEPNNPDVYIHAAEIDSVVLRAMQLRVVSAQQSGLSSATLDKWTPVLKKLRQTTLDNLEHGQALLNPSADNYEELGVLAIQVRADLNDSKGAIEAAQVLLKNRPDSLSGRLLYARLLKQDPSKWQEAADILAAPTSVKYNPTGVKAQMVKYQQMSVVNELTEIRCDQCATETDPTKKAALLQQVQAGYDQLFNTLGETPQTLKLKGRLLQLQGKQIEAIQALEKAQAAYQHAGQFDIELTNALAMSYWHAGQTGQARKLFQQTIDANPTYLPPRFMLTELLLEDNDTKDADTQIAALEHILPDSPAVQELRITSDIADGKTDDAKALFAKLPEKTMREQAVKAQIAQKMKDFPAAIRLVEAIHAAQPDQLPTLEWLVQLYGQQGDRDKAVKLVDQAIAAHPSEQALKLIRQQALASSPQQKAEVTEQAIQDSHLSPANKELQLYELARQQNKIDEAMKHLDAAEKLAPNDLHVLEMRLANDLIQKKWDDAQKYVGRLVKLNPDSALLYQQQVALARGNDDQAIDLANQVIAKMPEFANGYIALGASLQAEGRYQEAVNKYLDALERQNNNLRAIQGLIGCYYAMNRPQDAARYIAQARKTDPSEPLFREMEIEHSLKYGDGTLAITAREAAAKANPNDPAAQQDLGIAYLRAASYRLQQNDAAGAQPYIDKLRAIIADGMQRFPDNRSFFALAGELAITTKDFPAGQAAMNRMIAQPQWMDDPKTYLIVSDFYRRFDKMDDAEAALRESLDKGGGADYRMQLAQLLSQRGQTDKALALLEPMIETNDIDAERAQILLAANRFAQAEPIVQSLLSKNPNSPQLQKEMLQIEAGENKIAAVMKTATAMLAKDPKNDTALYYRAVAKMHQPAPDIDGSQRDLQAVLQDDPNNVDARYMLADLYRMRNDWDSAITQIQQALTAAPNNKTLRLKLIDLDSTAVPPRWSDVEQLINTALADPVMQNDPAWQLAAAKMWLQRGNTAQCVAAYQAAMKLAPHDESIFQGYMASLLAAHQAQQVLDTTDAMAHQKDAPSWMHDDRALAAVQLDHTAQAKSEILAAIAAPDIVSSQAAILTFVQSADAAQQLDAALQQATVKTPGDPRWQMLVAYLDHARHDDVKAAELMTQAATSTTSQLSPDEKIDAARWASMLNMISQPPDYEKAIAMSKLVLATEPDNTEQLNNLACMLIDSVKPPRPAEALQYSQHAYDLMQKSGTIQPLIQDTQGWALINNGQIQDGILLLRQVIDNKPFIDVYYHLAEAYLRSNQPAAALTQLKLANQTLDDLKHNKQAYDPSLPGKIAAAEQQAKQMSKMQASAPQ